MLSERWTDTQIQLDMSHGQLYLNGELDTEAFKIWGGYVLDVLYEGSGGNIWDSSKCPQIFTADCILLVQPLWQPDEGKPGIMNLNFIRLPIDSGTGVSLGTIVIEARLDPDGKHKVKRAKVDTYTCDANASSLINIVNRIMLSDS